MTSIERKKAVAGAILEYGTRLPTPDPPIIVRGDKEANELVVSNANAFLFALLWDEGQKAEGVWKYPKRLCENLGHLDPKLIANMRLTELVGVFSIRPRLRYPTKFAVFLKLACEMLVDRHGGDAANLWNDKPTAQELAKRLEQFYGVGQKKASMRTNMLVRDLRVPISGSKETIDISNDVMVQRVFLRAGLVENPTEEEIVGVARTLCPDYPGALDLPTWKIGRDYCEPAEPRCGECPIGQVCARVIK